MYRLRACCSERWFPDRFGVLLMFAELSGGSVMCALLGLVVFAGYLMVGFRRLREKDAASSGALLDPVPRRD
jgi:hypothetical protein